MNHSLPAGAWLKGSGLLWPEEDREAPAEDSSFTLSSTVFLIAAGETVSWSAMVCSSLEKQADTGSAFLRKDGAAASLVGSAQWDPIPGPFTSATPLSVIQLHNYVSHHSVTQVTLDTTSSHQDHSELLALNFHCPSWGRILFPLFPLWVVLGG